MAPRFNRARLITEEDRHYRQFLQTVMLSKQNQRATRPPRERDLFGSEAEEALRGWLSRHWELSDRRILEYEERRGNSWSRKYRELDAVILDGRQIHVVEIKASRTGRALLRAVEQLADTRQILSLLFQRIVTTILLVDTGIPTAEEVARLMRGPDAPPQPPITLADALALRPDLHLASSIGELRAEPGSINVLRFSVDDIIGLAGAENLHLNWDEDEEERPAEQAPEVGEEPADEQSADEQDDSPFAVALRRAMERRSKE